MKINCWPIVVGFILGTLLFQIQHGAYAAVYCYPHGMTHVCFSDGDRRSSSDHVKNPNIIIQTPPTFEYMVPRPAYKGDIRNKVPEQDFSECTLALGCIKGTR